MDTWLLDHLCCPECRGDLRLRKKSTQGRRVISGALACTTCGRGWPVRRGVPRFVESLPEDLAHTARNFGRSWKMWSGVDDERYRRQFLDWITPLRPEQFRGKLVLDAGCGKGRHLRLASEFGARRVVGVDLSDAVDVASENTSALPGVNVIQADLMRLPLKGGFDLAYSVGVLHHAPVPAECFKAVADQVRPGGTIACWVYGRENNGWIVSMVNPLRTAVTRHLPPWTVLGLAWVLAAVLFAAIHAVYVPSRAVGLKLFYHEYMLNLRRLGFAETRHIVYDHLIAPTAHYLRRDEVAGWFDEPHLARPTITWVNRNSWAGVGLRAAA